MNLPITNESPNAVNVPMYKLHYSVNGADDMDAELVEIKREKLEDVKDDSMCEFDGDMTRAQMECAMGDEQCDECYAKDNPNEI